MVKANLFGRMVQHTRGKLAGRVRLSWLMYCAGRSQALASIAHFFFAVSSEMDNAKVKVYTSLVMVVDTKDLGGTVDTLDLEYVRGKTADATKGKK